MLAALPGTRDDRSLRSLGRATSHDMERYFRPEVLESTLYSVPGIEGVKLNQNECPWDIPLDLKVRITERLIRTDWNRYPVDDLVTLQKRLADVYGVDFDQIVVSNGSNTIIQALINVIPVKSKVLILDPSFVVYEMEARLHGNPLVKVPLSEDFELLPERTLAAIKKERPGLVLIANPNAPTGTLFDKRSLYRIIQTARCPVVIDEAYYPFTQETVIEWLADFKNLVILRTLSKAYALAGVRFGFLIAHREIASGVEKFLMTFRISSITTAIVDEVLSHPGYADEYRARILKERGRLFSRMQTMAGVQVFPSEANFLLFRVNNAGNVHKKLMEEKILVRNVDDGARLKNCLRVAVGAPEENDRFVAALKKILGAV